MKIKKRYVIAVIIILFLNIILISSSENYGKTNSNLQVGEIASQSVVFPSSPKPEQTPHFSGEYKTEGFGDDSKVDSGVYKVLEKQDEVKIVVEIKEPGAQKGIIKTDNQKELEKDIIKEDIKNNVEEDSLRHEFNSFISLEVNETDLEKLKLNKDIISISPVGKVEAFLQDSVPLINASSVWPLQINNINLTGIDQTVCILDTGINFSHVDLIGKNKTSCLVDCLAKSCVQNCSIIDDHGHGTHVAGIVAASPSIYGVAFGVSLIGVKVLYSDGSGDFDDVAAGIEWCVNNANTYNISVITMSLGTNCALNPELCYSSYCDAQAVVSLAAPAVDNATSHNISVIIASGNNGNTQYISAPACIKNATAVGATDKSDNMWSNTNRNSLLDLLAPGASIYSTSKSGGYEYRTGTSMAAPHVAGAFAIISQLYKLQNNRNATPFEIQNLLNNTGKKINDSSGNGLNFSRIDVYSAALSVDSTVPIVNLTFPLNNHFNSSNNMSFNCNGNDWQLSNVTFYLWNSSNALIYNETKNISGISNTSVFVYNLENKNYKWNCLVKDLKGNSAFATSNNSLSINILSINLTSPLNQTYIKKGSSLINNTNFSCNSSCGEYGVLKNVTFYLWNSSNVLVYNETKNISGISNTSVFFYNLSIEDNYKWNCFLYNNYSNISFAENNNTIFYDITSPIVSNITSSASTTSATLSFSTNENCNHSINYGATNILGTAINNSNFSTIHSDSLSGLSASTTYYYNVSYCDLVGNCLSNGTYSFTTSASVENLGSGGGGGGGGGGAVGSLPITYVLTSSEIASGSVKQIKEKDSIKFSIENNSTHSVYLNSVTASFVKLSVFSNLINLTLFIGDEKKLNLTSSDYYDLYIKLNSIINNTASITVRNIHENIIKNNTFANITEEKKDYSLTQYPSNDKKYIGVIVAIGIIFIVVLVVIIIIIVKIIIARKKPRKEKLAEYRKIFNKKVKRNLGKKLPFLKKFNS